ncbi:MAG: GSCFA domain-containing protein [Bacteroidales bacterium]|nr:GSCFA domain-containing protein [Bacteroidales bacterium]
MKITTPVEINPLQRAIKHTDKIALFGSCFADEIGQMLTNYGFNTLVNPFGTLYNVCSIYNSITRLALVQKGEQSSLFTKEDIFLRPDNKLITFSHHSRYGMRIEEGEAQNIEPLKESYLQQINNQLRQASEFLHQADVVIITLGTSFVYRVKEHTPKGLRSSNTTRDIEQITNSVVSNCHKLPAERFSREFITASQCAELLKEIFELLKGKHIILTVSPIRHLADGAHANQISKASLLLAVEETIKEQQQRAENTANSLYYFPSYEIMMDELRDYRWYGEDMAHPTPTAVKYIFERFKNSCIAPTSYPAMDESLKRYKRSAHKIL